MKKDIPKIFDDTVEIEETYLGGKMKNRRIKEKIKYKLKYKGKRRSGFGTIKQPVFAILSRAGHVMA